MKINLNLPKINSQPRLSYGEKSMEVIISRRWIDIDLARTSCYINDQWVTLSGSDALFCKPAFSEKSLNELCKQLKACAKESIGFEDQVQEYCPVCLELTKNEDATSVLVLKCSHKIHEECLRSMVKYGHSQCSVCKYPLRQTNEPCGRL